MTPADWAAQTKELTQLHDRYRVAGLEEREFSQEELWDALGPIVEGSDALSLEIVGRSAEGRPLHLLSYGDGPIKVLLWSQMHGDESTATMALADIFNFLASAPDHPLAQRIAEHLTLRTVPMLNPDGAERFQRRNAQGIDINRDALRLATPEAQTLKALQERFDPIFGFNLHDQDVRTRVGAGNRTAAIALLAPSFNEAQDDNAVRTRAKQLSAAMRLVMEPLVEGHITRYEADFYPRAFGDNMQKWGVSTVLLESGGWENDPEKQYLRMVNFVGLLAAFDAIATGAYESVDISAYSSLPWNGSDMYDLLVLGGTVVPSDLPSYRADLAINYQKPLERRGGHLEDIGQLARSEHARDTIDASGMYIHIEESFIHTGMPVEFTIRRGHERTSEAVWMMDGDAPRYVASATPSDQNEGAFDIILSNGTIIDGASRPRYQADVGIRDGFIMAIGDLSEAESERTFNVDGFFVTPGFISVHGHPDIDVLDTAKNMLTQGVTTEIMHADGGGTTDIAGRLREIESIGPKINVGAYIGFNAVWEQVVGESDRRPTEEEFDAMRALIADGMAAGAWGVSSGLQYVPGFYADTDEVIRVVEAAAPWRTQYTSHMRNEYLHVLDATKETIEIGEKAGLAPMVTHMKVVGSTKWGASGEMLDMLHDARRRGVYAAGDQYPYLAGQTSLSVLVPGWALDGGFDALLERLDDPDTRAQIRDVVAERIMGKYGTASNVLFPNMGSDLAQEAATMDVAPAEAVLRLFEQEGNVSTIIFYGSEDDLVRFLQSPMVAVSCDCGTTTDASTHPRHYGSWPKVLGEFVREKGLLTWEQAIRKMTGLPATILGMTRRGFIAEGMRADITVFDPETIIDHATYEEPKQFATGVRYVFVNGEPALVEGEVTGAQTGRALRRTEHMPTRPMSNDMHLHISASGTLESPDGEAGPSVDFSLKQPAGRAPTGAFRLNDASRNFEITAARLGMLQATDLWDDGWAAFTGTARTSASNEPQPLLVIIDEHDVQDASSRARMIVRMGEDYEASGFINAHISIAAPASNSSPANSADSQSLKEAIQEVASHYPEATIGVAMRDPATDMRVDINADRPFHAASTMKIPVLIEVFRRVDSGQWSLDDSLLVENRFTSIVDGSTFQIGDDSDDALYENIDEKMSIGDLTRRMITVSSNLAANLLIEHLSAEAVQQTIEHLGTDHMKVLRGVEDLKAYRQGLSNTATAGDLATLMTALMQGRAVSPEADRRMIDILMDQEFNTMIPAGLPEEVPVAHKTGWITEIHHDAAIVYPPDQEPYVLVVLTEGVGDKERSAELVAEIARVVHAALRQ